jgi:hypothetical protein
MSLGLNANLGWKLGVDTSKVTIPGNLKGKVENRDTMKAFITLPDYQFELGRCDTIATGKGDSFALWTIEKPALKQTHSTEFAIIFKVPKKVKQIELEGRLWAQPNINLLVANLQHVAKKLKQAIRALLYLDDDKRKPEERLPIGDHEEWKPLLLPK